jgi:hypothetical protein
LLLRQNLRYKTSTVLALATAVVCAAGCGSSSSSDSRSTVGQVGSSVAASPLAGTAGVSTGAPAKTSTTGTSTPAPTQNTTGTSTGAPTQHTTTARSATPPKQSAGSGGTPGAVAAANTICALRSHELTNTPLAGVDNLPALAVTAQRRAAIERRALGELRRLVPPADVAVNYREVLAHGKLVLRQLTKLAQRARAGDASGAGVAKSEAEKISFKLLVSVARSRLKYCS